MCCPSVLDQPVRFQRNSLAVLVVNGGDGRLIAEKSPHNCGQQPAVEDEKPVDSMAECGWMKWLQQISLDAKGEFLLM